jgi:N-acetylglucosaminyldiphosphoundecaprenol N-acetyl-beta-D-mannosaminyltransferase
MSFTMLGIRIDSLPRSEALARARAFLFQEGQALVFTPNPEMLVKAQTDSSFREALNRGDLNLCDGRGIQLFAPEKVERITGVDFMLDVCGLAENEGKSVFLLGTGNPVTLEKFEVALIAQFPKLEIAGTHVGPTITERATGELQVVDNASVLAHILKTKPAILLVAFGMGKQEKWLVEYLPLFPSVKVALGVGGAFDYVSGSVPRAPLLLRKIGLEWLYRLLRQPRRLKRIWNATARFTYLVLYEKIFK